MAYDAYIWDYFYQRIKNAFGVAGLMGNLYHESGLRPNNLENGYETSLGYTDSEYTAAVDSGAYTKEQFVHDSAGYGLAQWTWWSRKEAMYNRYKNGDYSSIGCIELACDYLWWELENSYPSVLNTLKNASSVRQASDCVLHDFEAPADQSESMELLRSGYGEGYYDTYANGTTPDTPVEPDEPNTPNPTKRKAMSLMMMVLATRR